MSHRFLDDLSLSAPRDRTRPRWRGVPASIAIHAMAVSSLIPLMQRIRVVPPPETPRGPVVYGAGRPAAGPPRRIARRSVRSVRVAPPPTIPTDPAPVPAVETETVLDAGSDDASGGDAEPACISNCDGSEGTSGSSPEGEPGGSGNTTVPLRPGGDIRPPTKIRHVVPHYPDLARRVGVEGVVTIDCTIGTDGRVVDASVKDGHPLLRQAALDAVQQWLYTPTHLNGAPVAVILTVTVQFRLVR